MTTKPLEGKNVLVTGGTGSLGKLLIRRILGGEMGEPGTVVAFSRDEAKQNEMRLSYLHQEAATDEIIFRNSQQKLRFWIGDVRDESSLGAALRDAHVVFNAAALKQVPTCEYFPHEAVQTNVVGAENVVSTIERLHLGVETVVGISTDKACKPVNVMGMTKALQERVFIQANMRCPDTRFLCVRYGNVLASRGSVIPLFHNQIAAGGPVTITTADMTRFLLSLDDAVDTIFAALRSGLAGETYVPAAPSARVVDIAAALIEDRPIETKIVGIRPGEKIHEILISEEESPRTVFRDRWHVIKAMLPEVRADTGEPNTLEGELSSADQPLSPADTAALLEERGLLLGQQTDINGEFLR